MLSNSPHRHSVAFPVAALLFLMLMGFHIATIPTHAQVLAPTGIGRMTEYRAPMHDALHVQLLDGVTADISPGSAVVAHDQFSLAEGTAIFAATGFFSLQQGCWNIHFFGSTAEMSVSGEGFTLAPIRHAVMLRDCDGSSTFVVPGWQVDFRGGIVKTLPVPSSWLAAKRTVVPALSLQAVRDALGNSPQVSELSSAMTAPDSLSMANDVDVAFLVALRLLDTSAAHANDSERGEQLFTHFPPSSTFPPVILASLLADPRPIPPSVREACVTWLMTIAQQDRAAVQRFMTILHQLPTALREEGYPLQAEAWDRAHLALVAFLSSSTKRASMDGGS